MAINYKSKKYMIQLCRIKQGFLISVGFIFGIDNMKEMGAIQINKKNT